jgi:hypothetical protein
VRRVPNQHDGKNAVSAELCAIGKSNVWTYEPSDEVESRVQEICLSGSRREN